jgi:uncharacterized protein
VLRLLLPLLLLLPFSLKADEMTDATAESRAHAAMAAEPPAWPAAVAEFTRAAAEGSPTAMAYLGWIYDTGQLGEIDELLAYQWYARAARAGATHLTVKLGWMALRNPETGDRQQAELWFRRGIDAGEVAAALALASLLIADIQGGKGGDRLEEAITLLNAADSVDEPMAAYFLARIYREGIGMEADLKRAYPYLVTGAERGDAKMQLWLAETIWHQNGDMSEAVKWATLARAAEISGAAELLQALERQLALAVVQEGRRRAFVMAFQGIEP